LHENLKGQPLLLRICITPSSSFGDFVEYFWARVDQFPFLFLVVGHCHQPTIPGYLPIVRIPIIKCGMTIRNISSSHKLAQYKDQLEPDSSSS